MVASPEVSNAVTTPAGSLRPWSSNVDPGADLTGRAVRSNTVWYRNTDECCVAGGRHHIPFFRRQFRNSINFLRR